MSSVIPKEKLSAYQRWELASFDERDAPVTSRQVSEEHEQLLEALKEQARLEGYAVGFEQGQQTGLEEGRALAAEEREHLRQIADNFGQEVANANEAIANDVLDLSLDLAKAMLKTALTIRPELMLPIIGEAIRYLPTVQQPAMLYLHPEDAALVRDHMQDELSKAAWRVAEDTQLERGGCRIETPTNQIDATPSVRWQRIAAALGKESSWLEN